MFKETEDQIRATGILSGQAKNILLFGGSRSGKTFKFIRSIVIRASKFKSRHLILRNHFNSVKTAVWHDTFPKVMSLCFPSLPYNQNKSDWFIELPNGSQIWFGGLDSKERTEKVFGNEYSTIYYNECSQMSYESIILANSRLAERSGLVNKFYYDCNPPSPRHWSHKLFVELKDPMSNKGLKASLYASMLMNPEGNRDNQAEDYIETVLENMPDRFRRRFLLGEWVGDVEGALWKQEVIDKARVTELPPFKRIVIAVDPATTNKETSDETGIIIAGLGYDDKAYIIKDLSGKYSPNEWASKVVLNYHNLGADKVVAETNQGGDMIETILKNLDRSVSYKGVHAKRGKVLRAEPAEYQYEQGNVCHVGDYPELESELTTWIQGDASPNRLDALVYAVTELLIKGQQEFFVV